MPEQVRMGIIGGGLFAQDAHIPALLELGEDQVKMIAICSRTEEKAKARAAQFPYPVEVMTSIDAFLSREDIDAVNIILPISLMPSVVEKALKHGKHVISEKPIADNIPEGLDLLSKYTGDQVWMVAENYRYNESFRKAAELIKEGAIGDPLLASWTLHISFDKDNKYYSTDWRLDGSFRGGLLIDGGVHQAATLRMILGEVSEVQAFTNDTRDDLPGIDTICCNLRFDSGAIASLNITFSADSDWSSGFVVQGTAGMIHATDEQLILRQEDKTETITVDGQNTVRHELAAFLAAIREGKPHRNAPQQAMQDVMLIDAIIRSAETGQIIKSERII